MLKLSNIIHNYNNLESQDQKQQFLNRLIYLIESNFLFLDSYEFYLSSLSIKESVVVSYYNKKLKCIILINFSQVEDIVDIEITENINKNHYSVSIITSKNFQETLYTTRDKLKDILKDFLKKRS